MRDGAASVTARRVAAYRTGVDRLTAPFGNADADDRLAADVALGAPPGSSDAMARYLASRTTFFDRVVVNALERDVLQVVNVGAGYDGRSLRYARSGVRFFEIDHPDTQHDKIERLARLGIDAGELTFIAADLASPGLGVLLVEAGFAPDASSIFYCEGVAHYLDAAALASLLGELRTLATVGTRLAISLAPATRGGVDGRERFATSVEQLGEPVRNSLGPRDAPELLASARWREAELSERARDAGFVVAAPLWVEAATAGSTTRSRSGKYLEQTMARRGIERFADHLESTYDIAVADLRRLDAGVYRVERDDGSPWVARLFPVSRPLVSAAGDAAVLAHLERLDFPAERCAAPQAVSEHEGQAVLVTDFVTGGAPGRTTAVFRRLGELLGRLHLIEPTADTARRGGAWHHLASLGGPREEIDAAIALLRDAKPRFAPSRLAGFESLEGALAGLDDGAGLPDAFVHPDFVPTNVLDAGGAFTVVDWSGAGMGPRLHSLANLLSAAGTRSLTRVDAVIEGYVTQVRLENVELERLGDAVRLRPLVFDCWRVATGGERLEDVADGIESNNHRAAAIANRARSVHAKLTAAR